MTKELTTHDYTNSIYCYFNCIYSFYWWHQSPNKVRARFASRKLKMTSRTPTFSFMFKTVKT